MKNCIILHGCTDDEKDNPTGHWISWVKKELENKNIQTIVPLMPEPWNADYYKWKKEFDKLNVNEETILIGHSCGAAFLIRWLGDTKRKIKKLILVAPWVLPDKSYPEGENKMYTFDINENIRHRAGEIIIFTSNNEEEDGKKSAKIFQEALNAKLIELANHGHYVLNHMGTEEFPELLQEVLK